MTSAILGFLVAMQVVPLDSAASWQLVEQSRFGSIDDPTTALSRIRSAAITTEGQLVLTQIFDEGVGLYSFNGERVGSLSRRGEGPEELISPGTVGSRRDTVWVSDNRLNALKYFDVAGEWLGTVSIAQPLDAGGVGKPVSLLDNGDVLVRPTIPMSSLLSGRNEFPWLRFTAEGSLVDTLVLDARSSQAASMTIAGRQGLVRQPFDWSDRVEVALDGSGLAKVSQKVDDPNHVTVERINADGAPIFSQRYEVVARRLTPSLVRAAADAQTELAQKAMAESTAFDADQYRAAYSEAVARPDYIPPVDAVLIGADGRIWLRREFVGGDSQRWVALDGTTGSILGQIQLPAESRLIAASAEGVWLEELDELDVVHIGRYRILEN